MFEVHSDVQAISKGHPPLVVFRSLQVVEESSRALARKFGAVPVIYYRAPLLM